MPKLSRALAASALMTLTLSACASIETRSVPKCSGHDRRPLNADLWAWQDTQPSTREDADQPDLAMRYTPMRKQAPDALHGINELASVDQPRWDIAASEASCG